MKKGDDLFRLIKTLSRREARGFKLFLKRQQGKEIQRFISLYEYLREKENYDEGHIRDELKGIAFRTQFPRVKLKLKQLLLEFLFQKGQKSNPVHQLSQMIKEAQILQERGLSNQVLNACRRARKLAYGLDDQKSMLQIMEVESRIFRRGNLKEAESKLRENSNQRSLALKKLNEEEKLEHIYNMLYMIARKSGENPLLPDHKLLVSLFNRLEVFQVSNDVFRSELIRLHSLTLYNRLVGNQQAVRDFQEKVCHLWEKWPHQIKAAPNRYVDCLRGYMEVCLEQEDWSAYKVARQKVDLLDSRDPRVLSNLFFTRLHCSLSYANYSMQLEGLEELEHTIISELDEHLHWLKESYLIALRFNLFASFFLAKNYQKAFKWLKVMEYTASKAERKDLQDFARVAEAVLFFEDQEDRLFLASVTTHLTYFKRQRQSDNPESWFIKSLHKIYWEHGLKPEITLWDDLLERLRSQVEKFPVGWKLIEKWLVNKIQNA